MGIGQRVNVTIPELLIQHAFQKEIMVFAHMGWGYEMTSSFLHSLDIKDKAQLFDQFIEDLEKMNNKGNGTIYGSCQIVANIEQNAIVAGMHCCPYCGRSGK